MSEPEKAEYGAQKNKLSLLGKITKNENWILFLSSFVLALGMLLLSFAIRFVAHEVVSGDLEGTSLSSWFYAYGNSEKEVTAGVKWKEHTPFNPMPAVKQGEYYRIRFSFSGLNAPVLIRLLTDYSPVRVTVNGSEVYQCGYDAFSFVGTRFHSFAVDPSPNSSQEVDVYLKSPFSMNFSATVAAADAEAGGSVFLRLDLLFSLLMSAAGLILALVFAFLALKRRVFFHLVYPFLAVSTCGTQIAVTRLGLYSSLLSGTMWFNAVLFLKMLTVLFVFCGVLACFRKWTVPINLLLFTLVCLSFVLLFLNKPLPLKAAALLLLALKLLTGYWIIREYFPIVRQRIFYSRTLFVAFQFVLLQDAAETLNFVFGYGKEQVIPQVIAVAVNCFAMTVVLKKNFMRSSSAGEQTRQQIEKSTIYIEKIAKIISVIFSQNNERDFFEHSIEGICGIIGGDGKDAPVACAAVRNGTEFQEVYNNGVEFPCSYDIIAEKYAENKESPVFFASGYFDLLFLREDQVGAIIHFERVENGLSADFENIITTAYANMAIAYANFRSAENGDRTQEDIFVSLAKNAEFKSGYTNDHLKAVSEITRILCQGLGFPEEETRIVSVAAMVHDIGKIAIPQNIIDKKSFLTVAEREIIKQHANHGYLILSGSHGKFMEAAAVIARDHHEKINGTGYNGVAGEDIHLYARIVAVADVFDALTSPRSYKEPWTAERAAKYINDNAGIEFDAAVVAAFNAVLEDIVQIKRRYPGSGYDLKITV